MFKDTLTQYLSKHEDWKDGVQQGSPFPNVATRLRNFIKSNSQYEVNIGNRFFEWNDFNGRSGSKLGAKTKTNFRN